MGFAQKRNVVPRVCRAQNHRWDVKEEGMEKPLASFDREIDAITYASDLAKTKDGSRAELEGEAEKCRYQSVACFDGSAGCVSSRV